MSGRLLWALLFLAWIPLALAAVRKDDARDGASLAPPRGSEPPPPAARTTLDAPSAPERLEHLAARAEEATPPAAPPPAAGLAPPGDDRSAHVELILTAEDGVHLVPHAQVELTLVPESGSTGDDSGGEAENEQVLVRTADAHGRLQIALDPGIVRLVAWSGNRVGSPLVVHLAPRARQRYELALLPAEEVSGRVVSAATGQPVADAEVSFWTSSESDRVRTAADGTFYHPRFPGGGEAHQIRVEAPGHGATVRYLRFDGDGWILPDPLDPKGDRTGTGSPFVELELPRELVATGRVVDGRGRPLSCARISAEGFFRVLPRVASRDAAGSETDAEGRFELHGLRADVGHALLVSAPGFAERSIELVPTDEPLHELGEVVLEREALVAGVVVDPDGFPVEDIEVLLVPLAGGPVDDLKEEDASLARGSALDVAVRLAGVEHRRRTDSAGTFVFSELREDAYLLSIERDAGSLIELEVRPSADGSPTELELRLPPRTLTLVGTLHGLPDGVTGARVRLERFGRVANTRVDGRGRFRVAGLDDAGAYELTATGVHPETGTPLVATAEVWGFEQPVLELASAPGVARSGRR